MKKFRTWAIAGALALLMTLSSAGVVSAVAEDAEDAKGNVVIGDEGNTMASEPIHLNNVTAKELIVESGNTNILQINGGTIDKVSVVAPKVEVFDHDKIVELLELGIPAGDVVEMYQNQLKEKELLNTLKPTVKLAGDAVIEEVVVSGGATLNLAGGEVKEVSVNNDNNSERLTITIQNYDGTVNVNQKANADGTNNLLTINLKNSNLSELNVAGDDKCVFTVEGDKKSNVATVNVNGASNVTVDVDATDVRVTEEAEKSSVRIYSEVENVVVEADNSSLSLAAGAKVTNAKVEGDNVKVRYTGTIENSEVTGTGSEVAYQAPPTATPKPTATPTPTEVPRPEGEIIGNEDNSTDWWTAHSDTVKVEEGETEKITFYNYTGGVENWHNFVVVLQNVPDAHGVADNAAYFEYAAVRADNYGWGDGYSTAKLSSNWNWATFKTDMNGAKVELEVTNHGTKADVVANITTEKGKTYYQKYTGLTITGDLYYCLTVEGGCLIIPEQEETPDTQDPTETPKPSATPVPTEAPAEPTGTVVGSTDFSTGFFGAFSDVVTVANGATKTVTFKNYNNGGANWNNFLVVLNNVALDKEYAVMRADNWGWLNGDSANAIPDANKTSYWNWDNFMAELNGATVTVSVTNNGTTADVVANVTAAGGATYYQKYSNIAIDGDLSFRLTVDGCYLVVEDAEETPDTQDPTETPAPTKTVVGSTDFSTGFFGAFSDVVTVANGATKTVTFKNYNNGGANWNNFLIVLNNVALDKEYAVMRADNAGWCGDLQTWEEYDELGWVLESNWNWDNFMAELNGATVTVSVTNNGTTADVVANVTAAGGATYYQKYSNIAIDGDLSFRLSVDGCYLEIEE